MFSIISMILIVASSILLLVFIHELGHFWVARWYKIGVKKFSIGLGPHLISYTSHKTGTKWCLSAIPLGGYVRFYQQTEDVPLGQQSFESASALARLAVAAAGPLFNLLFALCVILGFNYQQGISPAALAQPLPYSALFNAGITQPTTIQEIGYGEQMYPVKSFQELMRHVETAVSKEQNIILQDSKQQNYFISYFDMTDVIVFPRSQPQPATDQKAGKPNTQKKYTSNELKIFSDKRLGLAAPILNAKIESIKPNEAAAFLGLKAGQKIVSIDGVPFNNPYLWEITKIKDVKFRLGIDEGLGLDVQNASFKHLPSKNTVDAVNSINPNTKEIMIDMTILRQKFGNSVLNQKNKAIQKELSEKMKIPMESFTPVFLFGFTMKHITGPSYEKSKSTWLLLEQSIEELSYRTMEQFSGIAKSIFGLKTENMSSVIGISQILNEGAETSVLAFLSLLALLSIGLACVNLLPIPLLDGWHILTALIEAVFKKPLPKAFIEASQRFGLMFLLFIFLSTLLQDIFKLTY